MSAEPPISYRVMVMDDEPLVLSSLTLMLDSLGHTVIPVKNGDEAIQAAKKRACCDFAILDLMIQNGRGGMEIAGQLRQECPNMKLILSSGFSDDQISDEHNEKFDGRLLKPFRLQNLEVLLSELR